MHMIIKYHNKVRTRSTTHGATYHSTKTNCGIATDIRSPDSFSLTETGWTKTLAYMPELHIDCKRCIAIAMRNDKKG